MTVEQLLNMTQVRNLRVLQCDLSPIIVESRLTPIVSMTADEESRLVNHKSGKFVQSVERKRAVSGQLSARELFPRGAHEPHGSVRDSKKTKKTKKQREKKREKSEEKKRREKRRDDRMETSKWENENREE